MYHILILLWSNISCGFPLYLAQHFTIIWSMWSNYKLFNPISNHFSIAINAICTLVFLFFSQARQNFPSHSSPGMLIPRLVLSWNIFTFWSQISFPIQRHICSPNLRSPPLTPTSSTASHPPQCLSIISPYFIWEFVDSWQNPVYVVTVFEYIAVYYCLVVFYLFRYLYKLILF